MVTGGEPHTSEWRLYSVDAELTQSYSERVSIESLRGYLESEPQNLSIEGLIRYDRTMKKGLNR